MNRNIDIFRHVLLTVSEGLEELPLEDATTVQHAVLLIDEGYLTGDYVLDGEAPGYLEVTGVSEKGLAFVEAVRSETVWSKTKRLLGAALDRMPLEAIRAAAEVVDKHQELWNPGS